MKLDAEAQRNAVYIVQLFFFQYWMRRLKFAKECGVLRSAFFLASACHRSPDGPLAACS